MDSAPRKTVDAKQDRGPTPLLIGILVAFVCLLCTTGAALFARGQDPLSQQDALHFGAERGIALGLFAGSLGLIAALIGRHGTWVLNLAALAVTAASGFVLLSLGEHKSAATDLGVRSFFLASLFAAVLVATGLGRIATHRALGSILRLMLMLIGLAGLFMDIGALRGSYRSLDGLLLGLAIGFLGYASAGALAAVGFARAKYVLGALFLLLAVLVLPRGGDDPQRNTGGNLQVARALLIARSPRLALIDRSFTPLCFEPLTLDPRADALPPPTDLDTPPAEAQAKVMAYRAERALKPPQNLLWITIDTLRADATGLHGGIDTPAIDHFAKSAFAFRRAFAQAPGTLLSMESFLTGYAPSRSGIAAIWAGADEAAGPKTIASVLKSAGYRTEYWTDLTREHLKESTFKRLPKDFEFVHTREEPGDDARRMAADLILRLHRSESKPLFLWAHFFDPHAPYELREGVAPDANAKDRWRGEVRHADRAVGEILQALEETGLSAQTLVVIHSDHGEEFGEHGRHYHATSWHDTQIRVPLYLAVPGLVPAVLDVPVANMDIMPTVLSLLGREIPAGLDGRDLSPTLLNSGLDWPRYAYADSLVIRKDSGWPGDRIRMIADRRYKLIQWLNEGTAGLYDHETDPGEKVNRIFTLPEERARLESWLAAFDRRQDHVLQRIDEPFARILETLRSAPFPKRQEALVALWQRRDEESLRRLEAVVDQLDSDTAHALLVMTQHYAEPLKARERALPRWPAMSPPLDFRARLAAALDPYGTPSLAAALPPPRNPFERHAERLALARRGERAALDALKSLGAVGDLAWTQLLRIGAEGGDASLLTNLQDLCFARFARGSAFAETSFLRAIEVLGQRAPEDTALQLLSHWPDQLLGHQPRTLGQILRFASSWPDTPSAYAQVAIMPLLNPETPVGSGANSGDKSLELAEIGRQLLALRKEESPARWPFARAEVKTRAARAKLPWPSPDPTQRSFAPAKELASHLELRVEAEALDAFSTLEVRWNGIETLNLGGSGALRAIRLYWDGAKATPDEPPPLACHLQLLPRVMQSKESLRLPLRLDWTAYRPGSRLTARIEGRDGAWADGPELRTSEFRLSRLPALRGSALGRATRSPLHHVLEEGAGIEVLPGTQTEAVLPVLRLKPGRYQLLIALRAYAVDAPKDALRLAGLLESGPLPLSLMSPSGPWSCEFEVDRAGLRFPRLVFPAGSALWLLESLELREMP